MRTHTHRRISSLAFFAAAAGTTVAFGQAGTNGCPTDCPQQNRITICYEGGRADNFAAPFDSTSRRPFFDAYVTSTFPGIIKQFDDTTENRVLGHTFNNLPCGIIAATLEVELQAGVTITSNDAIYLQYTGGTSFAWGSPIASLPGAGGTWNANQHQTFLLNLASLPGGTNLLPQMNTSHALDFLMQDDTNVEHMRLTITTCPCDGKYRTYTVGVADNFAPPTEPTFRRPRLTALRTIPPFLWKDNDDCTLDRGWGYTFQNIVPGVVRAQFGIRMKPCGGGSSNDGLGLDLINDGGPEQFSRGFNINLLPGAGTWTANPLTNFVFNLGATLPTTVCGSNLLGDFGDRTFDVYVQDDSGVDAARLRVQPCPPLKHAFGIPYQLLGMATADYNPATRRLPVHNLGSSGQDGVSFDLHGARGNSIDIDPAELDAWAPQSFFDVFLDGIDSNDDGVNDPLTKLHVEKRVSPTGVSGLACSVDDPTGQYTGHFTVTIYESASGTSTTLDIQPGDVVGIGTTQIESFSWGCSNPYFKWDIKKNVKFRTAAPVLVHGAVIMGDEIEFGGWSVDCSSTGDACPTPIESCSWSFGASNSGSGFLFKEIKLRESPTLCCRGKSTLARQMGPDCTLDTNPGGFTLANIGSSGQDGVEIDMDPADEWSTSLATICAGLPENCPPDAPISLSAHFTASINDQPGRDAGSSTVQRTVSSFFDIFYDVSLSGSNHGALVKVFDENGNMTGMFEAPPNGSIVAQTEGAPSGCGKQAIEMGGFRTACLWWDWSRDTTFGIPGRPPIVGRQIRILAGQPTQQFDYLQSVRLNVTGVEEMDVMNQNYVPISDGGTPCIADFNQDGGIDGADVQAFFDAWEQGASAADVNFDGGVDGTDVQVFFAAWEQGSC
ncbi:MAG: hypothetical protein JSR77_17390 [Planctomycetes bacterium]|nr:hypothetical protein [Planctomycetota bacterium]